MSRNSNRLLYKFNILEKSIKAPQGQIDEQADDELDSLAREFNREQPKRHTEDFDGADSSDEFGVFDLETYVSFDDKVRLSEQLKKCKNEKRLTRIVNLLQQTQLDSVEDIGSLKLQLRLDCIEKDAFTKCMTILTESDLAD